MGPRLRGDDGWEIWPLSAFLRVCSGITRVRGAGADYPPHYFAFSPTICFTG